MSFRAGAILGQGYSGIVICPAIPCTRDEIGKDMLYNYVSKIYERNDVGLSHFKNEINPRLLETLQRIDPQQKEFIYVEPITRCENIRLNEMAKETADDIQRFFDNDPSVVDTSSFVFVRMPKILIKKVLLKEAEIEIAQKMLDKLHDNGIVHNDLHDYNLVKVEDGTLRIIDFGASKTIDQFEDEELFQDAVDNDNVEAFYEKDDKGKMEDFNTFKQNLHKFIKFAKSKGVISRPFVDAVVLHVELTIRNKKVNQDNVWGLEEEADQEKKVEGLSKKLSDLWFSVGYEILGAFDFNNNYIQEYLSKTKNLADERLYA